MLLVPGEGSMEKDKGQLQLEGGGTKTDTGAKQSSASDRRGNGFCLQFLGFNGNETVSQQKIISRQIFSQKKAPLTLNSRH